MEDRVISSYGIEREFFHGWDEMPKACERLEDKINLLLGEDPDKNGFYWVPYGELIIRVDVDGPGVVCQAVVAYDLEQHYETFSCRYFNNQEVEEG